MSKDEIKKALECCSNPNTGSCKDCPYNYNDESHCAYGEMCKDALNLINEQENEIERLRTTLGQCNTELNSALGSLKSQCREIGKLRAKVKQAQIDILNKANERLNVVSREFGDDCDLCGVSAVCSCRCEINKLIKEIEAK